MEADGGLAGVRDYGLLESAVMMPQAQFGGQYLHDGIPAMAAASLFHMHRLMRCTTGTSTALMASLVFLDNNGYEVTAKSDDIEHVGLKVASGGMRKKDVIAWMRRFTIARGRRAR
jgi:death on curing protein